MIQKVIKYTLIIGLLFFVGYNSIYFKKLDKVKAENIEVNFDAAGYANAYYNKLLPISEKSIALDTLYSLLKSNPANAFDLYSHALGIGNIKYFLTQGKGKVTAVGESNLIIALVGSDNNTVQLATEFIYGNAIRDASGLIDINEFTKTADLNNVSAEINKKIRTEVLPSVKSKIKAGDLVAFTGALELNKQHLDLRSIEVIPISLKLID